MKNAIIAVTLFIVLVFVGVWYLDSRWCGIAALTVSQSCPGD
jgi:hypothetical protein